MRPGYVATILLMACLMAIAGCGASSETASDANGAIPARQQGASIAPSQTANPAPSASVAPAPTTKPVAEVKTGNSVGNRVPDFEIRLVDGSAVTSASLLSEGRPVFLFFFATW